MAIPKKNVSNKEVKEATQKGLGKGWTIKSGEGEKIGFYPFFKKNEQEDIECVGTKIKIPIEGGHKTVSISHKNLYVYVYEISNEEKRVKLDNMNTRQVRMIPYDVTIKIRPDEMKSGIVKRRVELAVSDLIAAYCQHEAVKYNIKMLNNKK